MASIGLVLSGGMAKGAYQIGVLKALDEFIQDDILYISASSIGSLNAYAYSVNRLKCAEEIWLNLKPDGVRSMVHVITRTPYIMNTIDSFTEENDKLKNNLYVTCFNVTKRKLNYIDLLHTEPPEIKGYLKASVAMPLFAKPVEVSGAKFLDGALVDNIPIIPLMKHHLDYIIVVHFDGNAYVFENEYFDNKLVQIKLSDDKIVKNALSFNRKSVSAMIKSGYEQGRTIFEMIFKNGTNDLDSIYEKILFIKALTNGKQLRITGDIVVGNINKILKRVVPK